jgi:predicted aspartyl protease
LYRKPYVIATLDGKVRTTLVDTGSQVSLVSADAAASMGVTPDALAQDRSITSYGATPDPQASRVHRFRELVVGPERMNNPTLVVVPRLGTEAGLVLGADFLRRHRLWISYASNRVYLGPAVAPAR